GLHKVTDIVPERISGPSYPSFAQIAGHAMNSIFVDSLEVDLERLQRINETLKMIPDDKLREKNIKLRPVETMMISPSVEINEISQNFAQSLPPTMTYLYRTVV